MAQLSQGGSARERSDGSNGGQGGRTAVSVERLALQVDRAGHCLAAGNERSAARRLRRFWADYLSAVGPDLGEAVGETRGGGVGTATPDLGARVRRAREAGTIGDDLADGLAALVASEGEDADDLAAVTARLLDLTREYLEGRVG